MVAAPMGNDVHASSFRWSAKVFWALWRICLPLALFEGVNTPLMFTALFLVSEWMTGYYLAFNFQVCVVVVLVVVVVTSISISISILYFYCYYCLSLS